MQQTQAIEQALKIKARYEKKLMKLANVVGVGVGLRSKDNQFTDEVALVVNVSNKKPLTDLAPQDVIPDEIEGIPVDVQEVGQIKAL